MGRPVEWSDHLVDGVDVDPYCFYLKDLFPTQAVMVMQVMEGKADPFILQAID